MPDAGAGVLDEDRASGTAEPATERASFRLAAFGALLIAVLFAGYGLGRLGEGMPAPTGGTATTQGGNGVATTPGEADDGHGHDTAPSGTAPHDDTGTAPHTHNADGTVTPTGGGAIAGDAVGGLTVTSQGLTIAPASTTFLAGKAQSLGFRIIGPGGAPVTTYAVVHDKPLHLVVIRRDLTGFQHLHPAMAPDGTWRVPLTLAAPGTYRAIADFTAVVGGRQMPVTLGVDLTVAGNYAPVNLPAPARETITGDFRVAYEGTPRTGSTQPLLMTVTTQGRPAALEPYLGAYGHLVVLREGDIGYVHVHPEATPVDRKVKFWLAAPGPGRYRMFFDFQIGGEVHTAAWTAQVS